MHPSRPGRERPLSLDVGAGRGARFAGRVELCLDPVCERARLKWHDTVRRKLVAECLARNVSGDDGDTRGQRLEHRKGRVSSLGATGEREHVRRCEKPFDVLRRRERDELVVDAEAARVRLRLGARSDCHRRNRDAAATQFADRRAQEVATLEAPRPAVVEDDGPVTRKADRRPGSRALLRRHRPEPVGVIPFGRYIVCPRDAPLLTTCSTSCGPTHTIASTRRRAPVYLTKLRRRAVVVCARNGRTCQTTWVCGRLRAASAAARSYIVKCVCKIAVSSPTSRSSIAVRVAGRNATSTSSASARAQAWSRASSRSTAVARQPRAWARTSAARNIGTNDPEYGGT